jgi:transcription initiation factor TFIIIB Brf1 subunit/transcription initiation factor TFIIB
MQCHECGEERSVDECVIIKGNVLCIQCGFIYIQHRLEHTIKLLNDLDNKLRFLHDSIRHLKGVDKHDRQG